MLKGNSRIWIFSRKLDTGVTGESPGGRFPEEVSPLYVAAFLPGPFYYVQTPSCSPVYTADRNFFCTKSELLSLVTEAFWWEGQDTPVVYPNSRLWLSLPLAKLTSTSTVLSFLSCLSLAWSIRDFFYAFLNLNTIWDQCVPCLFRSISPQS